MQGYLGEPSQTFSTWSQEATGPKTIWLTLEGSTGLRWWGQVHFCWHVHQELCQHLAGWAVPRRAPRHKRCPLGTASRNLEWPNIMSTWGKYSALCDFIVFIARMHTYKKEGGKKRIRKRKKKKVEINTFAQINNKSSFLKNLIISTGSTYSAEISAHLAEFIPTALPLPRKAHSP